MSRRHRLRHALVQLHDVVGRQLRQLVGAPGRERVRLVVRPVGALVVVVGAQEGVHALRAVPHVGVGRARRVVPLVVLARPRSAASSSWMSIAARSRGRRPCRTAAGGPPNGALISTTRAEHVRPHQRAPGGDRRAEVVADHGGDRSMPSAASSAERIPHQVEHAERARGRRRNRRPSRWCGHSRAGRARSRGSRPPRAAASPCASCRRAPGSRAAAGRKAGPACRPPARASSGR